MKAKILMEKKYPYHDHNLDNLPGEEWEDIPGLDGLYVISNLGRVKRQDIEILCKTGEVRRLGPKILSADVGKQKNKGLNDLTYFLNASITYEGKRYKFSIPRLVYYCFIKKFDLDNHSLVVLAKDGDGKNIHPENLILVEIRHKQRRIFERGRLVRDYRTSYDEYSRQGKKKSMNPYCRQVSQYSLEGKRVETFPSIKTAGLITGIPDTNIVQVLKDRQVSSGGFVWAYGKKGRVDVAAIRRDNLERRNKIVGQKVSQYNLKGKRIETYFTVAEAARKVGISSGDIVSVLKGRQRTAGGFIWKKGFGKKKINVAGLLTGIAWAAWKRQKKVKQYTMNGKYLRTFPSTKVAAQYMGVTDSYISTKANKGGLLRGYFWKYIKQRRSCKK